MSAPFRAHLALCGERDPERVVEALAASRRDRDGTRVALASDPAQFEAAAGKRCTDPSGEMRSPLAPVEARAAECTASGCRSRTEVTEEMLAQLGHLATIGAKRNMTTLCQSIGQRHAEASGEVIVPGARRPQRLTATRLRGPRFGPGHRHHA